MRKTFSFFAFLLLLTAAWAQDCSALEAAKGALSRKDFNAAGCHIGSMLVRYSFSTIAGEPNISGTYKWAAGNGTDPQCLPPDTQVYVRVEAPNGSGYIRLDPVVPKSGEDFGYTANRSPNWDRVICGSGTKSDQCLAADIAKSMWKTGLKVTGFQVFGTARAQSKASKEPEASIMVLIDTSGSMGSGAGSKMEEAKAAAIKAIQRALDRNVEVAVYAFSGDCKRPIKERLGFSQDKDKIVSFVKKLRAGGGTPLAPAMKEAATYTAKYKAKTSKQQFTVLLADGDNSCGSVADTIETLRRENRLTRYETIGLEVDDAAGRELSQIASNSGGTYRPANDVGHLAEAFSEAMDSMAMLNMVGGFGKGNGQQENKTSKKTGLDFSGWK